MESGDFQQLLPSSQSLRSLGSWNDPRMAEGSLHGRSGIAASWTSSGIVRPCRILSAPPVSYFLFADHSPAMLPWKSCASLIPHFLLSRLRCRLFPLYRRKDGRIESWAG